MRTCVRWASIISSTFFLAAPARSQSLGNAGTVDGSVVDQSGAAIPKAEIEIHNPVSGYSQSTISANDGSFHLLNIPPNHYHLEIEATGFTAYSKDVTIRDSLPVQAKATLAVAGSNTTVTVEGAAEALEIDPSAHVDADRVQLSKIPALDPRAGLSHAIVSSTGGVAPDRNGFFQPLGDHAQVGFVIDGQPITDLQSKVFSTHLPVSAVQSMELTTGTPHVRAIGTFSKENSDNLRRWPSSRDFRISRFRRNTSRLPTQKNPWEQRGPDARRINSKPDVWNCSEQLYNACGARPDFHDRGDSRLWHSRLARRVA
jgi:hypothetical protein